MSVEFFSEKVVRRSAKQYVCDGCHGKIERGQPSVYMTMKYGGDLCTSRQHPECREAEVGLAELHGLVGDEWLPLYDLEGEDKEWIEENHPAAHARLTKETPDDPR